MSYDRLIAEKIAGDALDASIARLEQLSGNDVYRQAWRKAARHLRARRREIISDLLAETSPKISQSSSQLGSPSGRLVPGG
jgi:hypothetical protein